MGKLLGLASVGAVLMISACTSPPEPPPQLQIESERQGLLPKEAVTSKPTPPGPAEPRLPFPIAGWLENGQKFAIVIGGSMGCPSFPSSIEVVDRNRMRIGVGTRGGPVCDAAWVGRTFVIRTPKQIDLTHEVIVQYGETTVRLPAL